MIGDEKGTKSTKSMSIDGSMRMDGWSNLTAQLVSQTSGSEYTRGNHISRFNRNFLDLLYRQNGFAKKIVDVFAEEMTRQWMKVAGDSENMVLQKFDEINIKAEVTDLIRWSRLYGGALGVIGIDDGRELHEPVDEDSIRDIEFLHIYDRHQVTWDWNDLYNDPSKKDYGYPARYWVTPTAARTRFAVHESRVIRLEGEQLPNRLRYLSHGWGDSVVESTYDALSNFDNVTKSTTSIVSDFVQTIISIDNLQDLLASGREDLVTKRMDIINMTRNVTNSVFLDSNEQYTKQSSSVSGLSDLMDRFGQHLAGVTGIPYSFLFGVSPAGLQSTGQADIRMFYDQVKSEQEDRLLPLLERLVRYVMLSHDGPFNGTELEDWKIEFNPLWQMTDKEEADLRQAVSQSDATYVSAGVLLPEEVAESRFGGGSFSMSTDLDYELREKKAKEAEQQEEPQENPEEQQNKDRIDSLEQKLSSTKEQIVKLLEEERKDSKDEELVNRLIEKVLSNE